MHFIVVLIKCIFEIFQNEFAVCFFSLVFSPADSFSPKHFSKLMNSLVSELLVLTVGILESPDIIIPPNFVVILEKKLINFFQESRLS